MLLLTSLKSPDNREKRLLTVRMSRTQRCVQGESRLHQWLFNLFNSTSPNFPEGFQLWSSEEKGASHLKWQCVVGWCFGAELNTVLVWLKGFEVKNGVQNNKYHPITEQAYGPVAAEPAGRGRAVREINARDLKTLHLCLWGSRAIFRLVSGIYSSWVSSWQRQLHHERFEGASFLFIYSITWRISLLYLSNLLSVWSVFVSLKHRLQICFTQQHNISPETRCCECFLSADIRSVLSVFTDLIFRNSFHSRLLLIKRPH